MTEFTSASTTASTSASTTAHQDATDPSTDPTGDAPPPDLAGYLRTTHLVRSPLMVLTGVAAGVALVLILVAALLLQVAGLPTLLAQSPQISVALGIGVLVGGVVNLAVQALVDHRFGAAATYLTRQRRLAADRREPGAGAWLGWQETRSSQRLASASWAALATALLVLAPVGALVHPRWLLPVVAVVLAAACLPAAALTSRRRRQRAEARLGPDPARRG